jgi:hypothetical protein
MERAEIVFASPASLVPEDFDDVLARCLDRIDGSSWAVDSCLSAKTVSVDCDDLSFFDPFFLMFGGAEPRPGSARDGVDLGATVRAQIDSEWGYLRMVTSDSTPFDGREFELAIEMKEGAFDRVPSSDPAWTCIAFRGADEPVFALKDDHCLFRLHPEWRKAVVIYLLCRYMRMHAETIFFHASSIGIGGRGVMFIGDKGAGKSTTALSLTARGHNFLGDEIAALVPSSRTLMPFRRPVGIKPGPRSVHVQEGLGRAGRIVQGEGFIRVAVESLFDMTDEGPAPLTAIVFLRPFEERPRLVQIAAGRHELAMMQPILSSFINAPRTQRVFELVRVLSDIPTYELFPGQPDETAIFLEEAFQGHAEQRQ